MKLIITVLHKKRNNLFLRSVWNILGLRKRHHPSSNPSSHPSKKQGSTVNDIKESL